MELLHSTVEMNLVRLRSSETSHEKNVLMIRKKVHFHLKATGSVSGNIILCTSKSSWQLDFPIPDGIISHTVTRTNTKLWCLCCIMGWNLLLFSINSLKRVFKINNIIKEKEGLKTYPVSHRLYLKECFSSVDYQTEKQC